MESPVFEQYYRQQLGPLFADDADWEAFLASLRTPLPVTFRISGTPHDSTAVAIRTQLQAGHVAALAAVGIESTPLPWYPGRLAWQVDASRKVLLLRRQDPSATDPAAPGAGDALRAFHAFLMEGADAGHVHRQEAASMVPPLLLNVKPGQRVLDM
jgi:16S rRNA C967 or C1407 C5-methylase (RsmB/RsmF family)